MLNENAKKWVAALRSGEYRQGRHVLHNIEADKWCCLGVACDIAVKEGVIGQPTEKRGCACYVGHDNCLPPVVAKWLNLHSVGGAIRGGAENAALWWLNDNDQKTFAEIADIIESEPPGLFVESEARDG